MKCLLEKHERTNKTKHMITQWLLGLRPVNGVVYGFKSHRMHEPPMGEKYSNISNNNIFSQNIKKKKKKKKTY